MASPAPYASVHRTENLNGPNDARPTGIDIVKDYNLVGALRGKVALVTGCSPGGIGLETARALHVAGADVYMQVRDLARCAGVVDDVKSDGGPGKVELVRMDLDSLQSVHDAADEFLRRSGNRCNLLILNAGR